MNSLCRNDGYYFNIGKGDCAALEADASFLFMGFVAMGVMGVARLMEKRAGVKTGGGGMEMEMGEGGRRAAAL